ncbi:hypothetical protein EV426DRAFT_701023 [Tirmania nivea]|nr:hypothetical protein EV426DRAFT_701023 [Tirmania nivea]
MANTEITPVASASVAPSSKSTKPGLSGPLSVRQTRMMQVANLYIHRGDSETQEKSYLDTFEQLKGQFKSLLEYYEGCREARHGGSKAGCSDETWDMLTRKVTGKGPSLRRALEKQKPHKMTLKQVLDLVSFVNTMELLLPSTQNSSADLSYLSSPRVQSPRLNGIQSHSREPCTRNLDGGMDSPEISLEDHPSQSQVRTKEGLSGDNAEQGLVGVDEENRTTMTNDCDPPTPPGGITYQLPTIMTLQGTEMSRSRFWHFDRPPPNSRASQVLPFQRLSTLLSASLSGGACTPGGGCVSGPKPPPSGASPLFPTEVLSNSDDIQAPDEGPSRASRRPRGDTSTVEDGLTQPGNGQNTSGQPTHRPRARPSALIKGNGLQRPKNPLGRILEEELERSQSIRTMSLSPALEQIEDACSAAMVRSQSNILGSLFLNAYPRPKPSATDTLLYWLLQDHSAGEDIPTFSRGQDQKSLFRLMICLWAEPIVGSGPFDKEWKRLLREREMRRWSEVGGEADVNVVSVLVMMSLFGAEVGLGLCRGQSKIRHRPVAMLENRVVSTASNSRTVTSPPRTPKSRQTSDRTTASREPRALSLPNSREGVVGVCPVCKRKGNRSTVCSCAYSLLQGMGVLAPTIPRNVLPPSPTSHSGRSIGRRSHPVGQNSGADSMVSRTRILPATLHTPKRPHTATQQQPPKVEVKRRPSTARDASSMSPAESLESTYSLIHNWRVDEMGGTVNAVDGGEAEASTNKVSTINLDWDPTSTPSVVITSQTEDSSPRHPLLAISDTTLSTTPALSEAYHNAEEVQLECEQDVNFTLFGAMAKLYAENAQSPETPASLGVLSEDNRDSAEEQLTPLTSKQVNLMSEDERVSELAIARKSKNREVFAGSGLLTSITGTAGSVEAGPEKFRDEDRPPPWMQAKSHSGSVGL